MRGSFAEHSGRKIPDLPDDFVNRVAERRPAKVGRARITLTQADIASDHRAHPAGTDLVRSAARAFCIRRRLRSGGCATAGTAELH